MPEVVEDTVAVNVTGWPTVEGFAEETSVVVVAAAVDARDVAMIGIASGLAGPLLSIRTVPLTVKPGKLSDVGANVTFNVQLACGERDAGQLFVCLKLVVV